MLSGKILTEISILYFNNFLHKIFECLQSFECYATFIESYCAFLKVQGRTRSKARTNMWDEAVRDKSYCWTGLHLRCCYEVLDTPQMTATTFSENQVTQSLHNYFLTTKILFNVDNKDGLLIVNKFSV